MAPWRRHCGKGSYENQRNARITSERSKLSSAAFDAASVQIKSQCSYAGCVQGGAAAAQAAGGGQAGAGGSYCETRLATICGGFSGVRQGKRGQAQQAQAKEGGRPYVLPARHRPLGRSTNVDRCDRRDAAIGASKPPGVTGCWAAAAAARLACIRVRQCEQRSAVTSGAVKKATRCTSLIITCTSRPRWLVPSV